METKTKDPTKDPMIIIGMPTGGSIRVETVGSLITNLYYLGKKGMKANLIFQMGGYVAVNRNGLVQEAIKAGGTHIMFIDGDMLFPQDGVYKLLRDNKEIVGANYNIRIDPLAVEKSGTTITMWDTKTKKGVKPLDIPEELFQAYSVATGFMLIDLKVFEKLKYPWFVEHEDKDGVHTTEDVEFCKRANKAGFKVWCDPTISMGHIGNYAY